MIKATELNKVIKESCQPRIQIGVSVLTRQVIELKSLLRSIYKSESAELIDSVTSELMRILDSNSAYEEDKCAEKGIWDSSSAVLITYADGVSTEGEPTLRTLKGAIDIHLNGLISIIHILPFLRSTSDGGFALSSHKEIDPHFGSWADLKSLSKNHIIMADLILNHVSASHHWVEEFRDSKLPGSAYIFAPSSEKDWKKVIRPRNTSLFTSLKTKQGKKDVWTTFGPDQIDLNWKNPYLLIEFLNIIIRYLKSGIRWFRLDAIGYIWKEEGTTCLHSYEAHQIVRAIRFELNLLSTKGVIITETNVPHRENISYLCPGNEANLAYNFSLPPLLLESLLSQKADLINLWLSKWPRFPKNTSFLNFTASHDGIGLRAIEGLMDKDRLNKLLIHCEKRGGLISHRRLENGKDEPYELNISWWSAMADDGRVPTRWQQERFLLSQLFAIALQGVPAFYLQAILASENDMGTFLRTGQRRDLNRERFKADYLFGILNDSNSIPSKNIKRLKSAMKTRSKLKAFHPEEPMNCESVARDDIVIFTRGVGPEKVWAIHNMTDKKISLSTLDFSKKEREYPVSLWVDCLNKKSFFYPIIQLNPYAVHWLVEGRRDHE